MPGSARNTPGVAHTPTCVGGQSMTHPNDTIPYGYCQCGCGKLTPRVKRTRYEAGVRKGEPARYIQGHFAFTKRNFDIRHPESAYDVDPVTQCHIWKFQANSRGYGKMSVGNKSVAAHVWFYERRYGPVPSRIHLHHTCENPKCVNPDHLVPLSSKAHRQVHAELMRQRRWAKEHSACTECGLTERKHVGHGLCKRCDGRRRRANRTR